jgi:hypothetical protein
MTDKILGTVELLKMNIADMQSNTQKLYVRIKELSEENASLKKQLGISNQFYKDDEGTLRWEDTDQPLESQLWDKV